MAEQKQKLSRSRSRKRRGQDKISSVKLIQCTKCKSKIPSHMVCPVCGTYKNQELVKTSTIKTKVTSKKAEKSRRSEEVRDPDQKASGEAKESSETNGSETKSE